MFSFPCFELWAIIKASTCSALNISAVPRDIRDTRVLDWPQTTLHTWQISPLLSKLSCSQIFFIEGQFPWLEEDFPHQNFKKLKRISSYRPLLQNPNHSQLVYDYKGSLLSVDSISSKPKQMSWVPFKAIRAHTLCFPLSENNLAPQNNDILKELWWAKEWEHGAGLHQTMGLLRIALLDCSEGLYNISPECD